MMDFEGEYQVNFTWDGDIIASKLSSVEVVLAPAKSVWDDHFDENDYHNHTVSYCLQKLENGMFEADIPLKMDTYHFLFRLNGGCDFAASNEYNVTYLANGRKLNYINVGDIVAVLLNNPKFEGKICLKS